MYNGLYTIIKDIMGHILTGCTLQPLKCVACSFVPSVWLFDIVRDKATLLAKVTNKRYKILGI